MPLAGSRANPFAPKDQYQDYDIAYLVPEVKSFTADHSWLDVFGERLMLQMPEAMRNPSGDGHFNYQMNSMTEIVLTYPLSPLPRNICVNITA